MKRLLIASFVTLIGLWHLPAMAAEPMVITYRAPEDAADTRYDFDNKLLKLALDKTTASDGPYILKPSPVMNFDRAIDVLNKNTLPNFMTKLSYEDSFIKNMAYVPIPTDRGIVGYRVFFVAPQVKAAVTKAKTLDDLKHYKIVQGSGWSDIKILEHAGLQVTTLQNYAGIFDFVAAGRADLFPRGANEVLGEYESYKSQVPNLDYDRSLILYYPLPRFFFTSKGNDAAIARITKGLQIAWKDGSYQQLWNDEYQRSVDFLALKKRHIITIDNPYITTLGGDYKKYLYTP